MIFFNRNYYYDESVEKEAEHFKFVQLQVNLKS